MQFILLQIVIHYINYNVPYNVLTVHNYYYMCAFLHYLKIGVCWQCLLFSYNVHRIQAVL